MTEHTLTQSSEVVDYAAAENLGGAQPGSTALTHRFTLIGLHKWSLINF